MILSGEEFYYRVQNEFLKIDYQENWTNVTLHTREFRVYLKGVPVTKRRSSRIIDLPCINR